MGGGVVMQYLRDRPAAVRSVTLVNPVSPYGFGGTHGVEGTLNSEDGSGSGGATANPEFVTRLAKGDRGKDSPVSPAPSWRVATSSPRGAPLPATRRRTSSPC